MPLVQTILYLLVGAGLLWKAGDFLVDGAVRLSTRYRIPPALAGVFILGFGTSFPELAVSGMAAWSGDADIAAGNVVGSNIANVALILGLTAALAPVLVNRFLLRIEIPIAVLASILAFVLVLDARVSRVDGLVLLGAFAAYALVAVRTASLREVPEERPTTSESAWLEVGLAAIGLVGVLAGGWFFLEGAKDAAVRAGMSQAAIGQTLVAVGTSLPELATSVAAARARQPDMALGNVVGSNIFNVLLVLGVAGVLRDQNVSEVLPQVSLPLMTALAIYPWALGALRGRIGRFAGLVLILTYAGFVAWNLFHGGAA
ncbi:MAG: calcium/sodium antiporter [Planctomycetota bacterium]